MSFFKSVRLKQHKKVVIFSSAKNTFTTDMNSCEIIDHNSVIIPRLRHALHSESLTSFHISHSEEFCPIIYVLQKF